MTQDNRIDTFKSNSKEIDLLDLLQFLLQRAWAIMLAAVLFGAAAFGYSSYYIVPKYQASSLLFVNSGTFSLDSKVFTISSGSVSGASSLVDTYIVILKTRMTLNEVIEEANLPYSYETLSDMISAESVNDTGIFKITVTSTDPNESQLIANSIAQVLQVKIADIVDGSSVRVVDYAVAPANSTYPDIAQFTLKGFLLGAVLVSAVFVVIHLLDTTIHNEEDLAGTSDIPILAEIPDLFNTKHHRSDYYGDYYGGYYGYGGYGKTAYHKETKTKTEGK